MDKAIESVNPVLADPALMMDWAQKVATIPHDCIEQCACNAVDASITGATCVSNYVGGTCGQTIVNPEDATDNILYCDVLTSPYSGLAEEVIKAEQNVYSQTRRLQVEERRLKIKERRRLAEVENNAACKNIDGKTFCPEGKEPSSLIGHSNRKLQDHVDELEANGVSYLIPSFVPKASPHKAKIIRSARSVRANAKKNRKARKLRVKQRANLKRRLTGRKGRGRK
jgi:hypothetical protein